MSTKEATPVFGVVSEGPSDHAVLRYVLAGFYSAKDVVLNPLQPVVDKTGGLNTPGGWPEVLRYCASDKLEAAFQFNDYVILQIDTDVCEEAGFDVSRRDAEGHERSPLQLIEKVRERLVQAIGADVFARRRGQILFAICVESIECWLLPIYWTDNRREKTVNCLASLNERLVRQEAFSIDPEDKHVSYYRRIVKPYAKRRTLLASCRFNLSFGVFIDQLPGGQPSQEEVVTGVTVQPA